MRICYQNTIDDLVAFNRFHCAHSPTVRRGRFFQMCFVAFMVLALTTAAALAMENLIIIAAGVVGAAIGALLVPSTLQGQIDRQVRKLYVEGANKDMLGPHELELRGEDLIERTPFGESRTRLEIVERIASGNRYTFIYVSAVTAHVIPHHAVTAGDPEAFADAVRRQIG